MAINVKQLLSNRVFKNFEVINNHIGLHRLITHASILDYEFVDQGKYMEKFDADSLVISSLLFAKEDPKLIIEAMKCLAKSKVSAFAFKNVFFEELPNEVIEIANKNNICLLKFHDTYFDAILFEVMKQIYKQTSRQLTELELMNIVLEKVSDEYLNQFLSYYDLPEKIKIIAICNNHKNFDQYLKIGVFLGQLNNYFYYIIPDNFNVVSIDHQYAISSKQNIKQINSLIQQAFISTVYSNIFAITKTDYQQIGIYQTLVKIALTNPIQLVIDQQLKELLIDRNSDLLKTAIEYVLACGDIELCASSIHCHDNTIRYRLKKIKEIINDCAVMDLYSQLFMPIHLYLINNEVKNIL